MLQRHRIISHGSHLRTAPSVFSFVRTISRLCFYRCTVVNRLSVFTEGNDIQHTHTQEVCVCVCARPRRIPSDPPSRAAHLVFYVASLGHTIHNLHPAPQPRFHQQGEPHVQCFLELRSQAQLRRAILKREVQCVFHHHAKA